MAKRKQEIIEDICEIFIFKIDLQAFRGRRIVDVSVDGTNITKISFNCLRWQFGEFFRQFNQIMYNYMYINAVVNALHEHFVRYLKVENFQINKINPIL